MKPKYKTKAEKKGMSPEEVKRRQARFQTDKAIRESWSLNNNK